MINGFLHSVVRLCNKLFWKHAFVKTWNSTLCERYFKNFTHTSLREKGKCLLSICLHMFFAAVEATYWPNPHEKRRINMEQLHRNGRQTADSRINRQTKRNGQQIVNHWCVGRTILTPISSNQASKAAENLRKNTFPSAGPSIWPTLMRSCR